MSPVGVVRAALTTRETLDVRTAQRYLCNSDSGSLSEAWKKSFVQVEAPGIDATELLRPFPGHTGIVTVESQSFEEHLPRTSED